MRQTSCFSCENARAFQFAPASWWRGFQPAPEPQPAPGSQPAPGPWWSGFRSALHRRRFRKRECYIMRDPYTGRYSSAGCFDPFGIWNINYV